MRNKLKTPLLIFLLLLFFLAVPLLQSLLFSSKSQGKIDINKTLSADFIQSEKKNILLYFGYVGCTDVCMPFLYQLSDLYNSKNFEAFTKNTDIFFVNLTPDAEPSEVDRFAKFFNKNFKGIYLSKRELYALDRNFALFFSESLSDMSQVNHTDHLYYIQNKADTKVLQSIYFTHPLSIQKLIHDMINTNTPKLGNDD